MYSARAFEQRKVFAMHPLFEQIGGGAFGLFQFLDMLRITFEVKGMRLWHTSLCRSLDKIARLSADGEQIIDVTRHNRAACHGFFTRKFAQFKHITQYSPTFATGGNLC